MANEQEAKVLTISKEEAARRAMEVERLVPLAKTQEERDSLLRLASDLWAKS